MNRLIKSTAGILLALSPLAFLSCDDESNIIGLNDLTKYGSIKVTLEGTRPDGEAYEFTRNFRFTSSTGPEYSSSVNTGYDGDTYRNFEIIRYAGAINESWDGERNQVWLQFTAQEEEDTQELVETYGDFEMEFPVTTSDKQFFYVNEDIDLEVENVSNYKYNENTGKLSFKYVQELTGQQTNSGFPLKVTIEINVTVFEYMDFEGQFD